jgi:hypothetical protein
MGLPNEPLHSDAPIPLQGCRWILLVVMRVSNCLPLRING